MRLTAIVTFAVAACWVAPAAAQTRPRFYVGGSTAADLGWRGPVSGGAVPSAGVLFGVRVTEAWSVELEADRAFREKGRTDDAMWISFAPANSTREEIERVGIRARWVRTETAGRGGSAHVMWRSRAPGRLNAALFGGVSVRQYHSRTQRTILSVPAEAGISQDNPLLVASDSTRALVGGGLTGGLLVLVRLTSRLTVAPELRYTFGIITNDPYQVVRPGVRMMWRF